MANNTRYEELVKMKGAELIGLADSYGIKCAANKERTQLKERKSNVVDRIYDYEQAHEVEEAVETTAETTAETTVESTETPSNSVEEAEATIDGDQAETTAEPATAHKKAGRTKKALPINERIINTLEYMGIDYVVSPKGGIRVVGEDKKSIFTSWKLKQFTWFYVNPAYIKSQERLEAIADKVQVHPWSTLLTLQFRVQYEDIPAFLKEFLG